MPVAELASDAEGAQAIVGPATRVVDLKGAALFPGFTDAHAHLRGIGERELSLNLEGSKSAAEAASRVAADLGVSRRRAYETATRLRSEQRQAPPSPSQP